MVKEADLKSAGHCPHRFKSYNCRKTQHSSVGRATDCSGIISYLLVAGSIPAAETSLWRNRIAHPTSNREVVGSIPARDITYLNQ